MDNQQPSNNIFYQKPREGFGFIYKYTSPSNKNYIGQTINSLAARARSIVSGYGYKKCALFWKAIQKYQFPNFTVEILKEVKVQDLNYWEEYYIKKFHSLAPNGYNLVDGGGKGKSVEVYVYSAQNGQFLEHYRSLSEASIMTNVPLETISAILSGSSNRRISHNLTFSKNYVSKIDVFELKRENYRDVYVYDQNGNYLNHYISVASAAKDLKIAICTISRHLESKTMACGYYFREEKEDRIEPIEKPEKRGKMVRQIDPNTLLTIGVYTSLAAAAKAVGLASVTSITRAIKRNGKAKGFYWKIIEGSTTKRP